MTNSKSEAPVLTPKQQALLNYINHECEPDMIWEALRIILFQTTEDAVDHTMINGPAWELWRLHETLLAYNT